MKTSCSKGRLVESDVLRPPVDPTAIDVDLVLGRSATGSESPATELGVSKRR